MPSSAPLTRLLFAAVAGLALQAAPTQLLANEAEGQLSLEELRTFADVYNQIRAGYVNEIDDSTLLEYAIQGMLTGLDPHSVYMTKDQFTDLQEGTSGEFSGQGDGGWSIRRRYRRPAGGLPRTGTNRLRPCNCSGCGTGRRGRRRRVRKLRWP